MSIEYRSIEEKVGYYKCNGINFQAKIDALLYASKENKPVEWMFFQDEFSKYPWTIEPLDSLDSLYDKRSKDIREKYDYVILSYSGGSDSNNILESFIRQNLHIDEIITSHITDATKRIQVLDPKVKSGWNYSAEYQLQILPRLDYIKNTIPNTKITILDTSDMALNLIKQFDDVDWVLGKNDQLSVGQLFRYNYFNFSDVKKQLDKNLKVAIIVGIDKPKIRISRDNKVYTRFVDIIMNAPGASINSYNTEYSNVSIEPFYWSAEALPILCKQAHVIKKWLIMNPDKQFYWRDLITDTDYERRKAQEILLRNILYSTWNQNWFQTYKSCFPWQSEGDSWFTQDPQFSKEYGIWKKAISFLTQKLGKYVVYDKKNEPTSLVAFVHEYYIGDMKLCL